MVHNDFMRSILFLVSIAVIVILFNAYAFREFSSVRPSFVEFGYFEILTDTSAMCPGDTIEFISDLHVKSPTLVLRGSQIWEIGKNAPALPAQIAHAVIAVPRDFTDITLEITVPDLPPGDYRREGVFALPGQAAATISNVIPFTIREGCNID